MSHNVKWWDKCLVGQMSGGTVVNGMFGNGTSVWWDDCQWDKWGRIQYYTQQFSIVNLTFYVLYFTSQCNTNHYC